MKVIDWTTSLAHVDTRLDPRFDKSDSTVNCSFHILPKGQISRNGRRQRATSAMSVLGHEEFSLEERGVFSVVQNIDHS